VREVTVPAPLVLATQFSFALVAYTLVAKWWIRPALRDVPLDRALPPLLLLHLVRPVSMWLLVPGVLVRPTIPSDFASGTAYGDLLSATLAFVAVLLVRRRHSAGVAATWVFNVIGSLDILRNVAVGMLRGAPEHMGGMVFVPAYGVPLLLVSHALVFVVLLDHRATRREMTHPRAA
jgi:hypothetical protein